jgi:hypothetical protein
MEGRITPEPYVYPSEPHVRRHGPRGWKNYRRYRPWLRDEFSFRCVYCLEREVWRDRRKQMHIDHFTPQAIRKDLKAEYTNLLYACPACNEIKSDVLLPDPCKATLGQCLRVNHDGRIEAIDKAKIGRRLIDELGLDDPLATERRRIMIGMLQTLAEHNWPQFVDWMRYPKDLPNLNDTLNKSKHNDKPEGVAQSFYEKRQRSELPEVY